MAQAVRAAPVRRPIPARRAANATAEVRVFVGVSAAICLLFVLALLYLAQTTAVASRGYEEQRLARSLAELRRQNALLEVENERLDSPARIEAEAKRIGLIRLARVPIVQAEPVAAHR